MQLDLMLKLPPLWLLGLPPVVEAKHDGEGAGGQQLPSVLVLLVLIIQTVSRCQCKSVSNLGEKQTEVGEINQVGCFCEEKQVGDELTSTAEHLLLIYLSSKSSSSSRRSAAIQG